MKKLIVFSIIAFFMVFASFADNPLPEEGAAKYYDNARVIKVNYSEGDAYIRRSFDEGQEEAGLNIPIFEKDIAGTNNGRLDIYLGRSNFLRLDYDTEVEFQKIPELRKTDLRIFIARGGIYLDLNSLDYEKDVEIQTPDCGVFILNRGIYRVNFNGEGGTEVFVYEGLAEVAGTEMSRNVLENQKIVMRDGAIHERPYFFYATEKDNFDMWNEERHNQVNYARTSSSRYLDRGYEDNEYELSRTGRWRYSSEYGTNIWIPYNVSSGWRPYYNGRWIWTPYYGYYWYSYDPWDSFTYHYGRWHYDPFWGWHWLPGYRWSPAWVGWCYSGSYYGWAPLSWYNRPVIVINKRWLKNYNYRNGVPFNAQSAVFIRSGDLGRPVQKVALSHGSSINPKLKALTYTGAAPAGKVTYKQVNVQDSKGRTVKFKESGIRSGTYYKSSEAGNSGGAVRKSAEYKYTGNSTSGKNTFKYSSGNSGKTTRGISTKSYKSGGNSSAGGTKKSTTTSTGSSVKKKKDGKAPSFSYSGYSASRDGSSYYSSRTSTGFSGAAGRSQGDTRGYSAYKSTGNAYKSSSSYGSGSGVLSSYKNYRSSGYTSGSKNYSGAYSGGSSYKSGNTYSQGSGTLSSYKNYSNRSSSSGSKGFSGGTSRGMSTGSVVRSYSGGSSSSGNSRSSTSSSSKSSSGSVKKK